MKIFIKDDPVLDYIFKRGIVSSDCERGET